MVIRFQGGTGFTDVGDINVSVQFLFLVPSRQHGCPRPVVYRQLLYVVWPGEQHLLMCFHTGFRPSLIAILGLG